MTIPRMVGLLIGLALIGIAVVWMRVDQARHVRRIQTLKFEQADLRQQIRDQEMEMAQLRHPGSIRERFDRMRELADEEGRSDSATPSSPGRSNDNRRRGVSDYPRAVAER